MARTAIVRFHPKHIVILCPNGHYVASQQLDRSFGGSAFEATLGAHQMGRETWIEREAIRCATHDATEALVG